METREPSYTVGGNVNWCGHYGDQYGDSLKTKKQAIIWPCNSTPGQISKEKHDPKGYMHPNIHCSTVYNNQDMEAN